MELRTEYGVLLRILDCNTSPLPYVYCTEHCTEYSVCTYCTPYMLPTGPLAEYIHNVQYHYSKHVWTVEYMYGVYMDGER